MRERRWWAFWAVTSSGVHTATVVFVRDLRDDVAEGRGLAPRMQAFDGLHFELHPRGGSFASSPYEPSHVTRLSESGLLRCLVSAMTDHSTGHVSPLYAYFLDEGEARGAAKVLRMHALDLEAILEPRSFEWLRRYEDGEAVGDEGSRQRLEGLERENAELHEHPADVDLALGSNSGNRLDVIEQLSAGEGQQRARAERAERERDDARERAGRLDGIANEALKENADLRARLARYEAEGPTLLKAEHDSDCFFVECTQDCEEGAVSGDCDCTKSIREDAYREQHARCVAVVGRAFRGHPLIWAERIALAALTGKEEAR